ncbi:nucleotidyltransferase/DNA polymerase involved in DNA repair [Lederbergia galactosidilyticus]|uniref:DNA polymerase IV n=1 Tax=Lederbergia galactosidilytica TaxID=217031 RepID=UPI001AE9684E|nr:DNA polymerase IV [Lederbergia galactosidilytica]MBP1914707.1 nucleotidyltransferase/DNA polymerase involved in DNA repair [Lederbergia galactosidilytica]
MKKKVIFLVDMQSFYASIEKAAHPELAQQPVIISGDPERRSGVVLAACPLAKKHGVQNASRLWEAQKQCPQAIILRPRMQLYVDISIKITNILNQFTDLVEVYSIDEQFLDVTASQHLFGEPLAIAKNIQATILNKVGIKARVGIGPNKILAKMACDQFAKKNKDGIFQLDFDNIEEYMWKLPIEKMFGIGRRMEQHLKRMGIRTIGHLANFPLHILKKRWGINGEVLWQTANGINHSPVTVKTHDQQKAIGHHMTLPRDYNRLEDIKVVLLELSEEVARRARFKDYMGGTVSLSVRGTSFKTPTGFQRQLKLTTPTHFDLDIFHAVCLLFQKYWDGLPVRSIGVTLSQLQIAQQYQLNLFNSELKKEKINQALDFVYLKYGPTALIRASSLNEAGQAFHRAEKIGGHYK